MALQISVAPSGDQWIIRSEALDSDLVFDRGGLAETTARRLADGYARSGVAAEVRVFLKDGSLAGAFLHNGAAAA